MIDAPFLLVFSTHEDDWNANITRIVVFTSDLPIQEPPSPFFGYSRSCCDPLLEGNLCNFRRHLKVNEMREGTREEGPTKREYILPGGIDAIPVARKNNPIFRKF